MSVLLACITAALGVSLSIMLSAPVWIILLPILLRQQDTARLVGLLVLGAGVDWISAHPPLLLLLLPLFGWAMRRLEEVVEQSPLFFFATTLSASLLTLLFLVFSRLFVAGAQLIPLSPVSLLTLTYTPGILGTVLVASAAAALYESSNTIRPSLPNYA